MLIKFIFIKMSAHAVSILRLFPLSPPSPPIIHYSCWALARLFWVGASCPCWRFLLYVLFMVFHRCFFFFFFRHQIEFKRNLFETHFCYYFMAHDEKNRNLLAVNFTHSPRSLRQSLVFFLLPLLLLFFVFLLSKWKVARVAYEFFFWRK